MHGECGLRAIRADYSRLKSHSKFSFAYFKGEDERTTRGAAGLEKKVKVSTSTIFAHSLAAAAIPERSAPRLGSYVEDRKGISICEGKKSNLYMSMKCSPTEVSGNYLLMEDVYK